MKDIRYFVMLIFFISGYVSEAQEVYKKFYHPNGTISAEGYFSEGHPVGLWKSYYPDGTLKTIGQRKNSQPDSIWKFYNRAGLKTGEISYKIGIRSGYSLDYKVIDSLNTSYPVSEILYVNGKKNGKSTYFSPNGKKDRVISYKDGYRHGLGKFFNSEGRIITLRRYSYDNIISVENINRTDKQNLKQGVWKKFYPNNQLHTFSSYLNDTLHGYQRIYSSKGRIVSSEYYIRGKKQATNTAGTEINENPAEENISYHSNGSIKSKGYFINKKPIGIHRNYSAGGEILKSQVYDSTGVIIAEGKYSKEGKRVGQWQLLFPGGQLKAKGNFKSGKKHGPWLFYYTNGNTEQKGSFKNGKPTGAWKWFYSNKDIRRRGNFKNGKEYGEFIEYNQQGDTLRNGNYRNGLKTGEWFFNINGTVEQGNYSFGLKEGSWSIYYPSGIKYFEGNFIGGLEDGEHFFYYPSGTIKLKSFYFSGQKAKKWYKYDPSGLLKSVTEYKGGEKYKINGTKLK